MISDFECKNKVGIAMLRCLLCLLFLGSNIAQAQLNELPDFTGLVEKYGAAVVNISATQNINDVSDQMLPEIPGIPEDSLFMIFLSAICNLFLRQENPNPDL